MDIDGISTSFLDIERKDKTTLTVKRSLFSSDKNTGFVLKAGDDSYVSFNANNLDGARIIGNKFIWTGYSSYPSSSLHGAMLGYNVNYTVKHNYNDGMPLAFIYKAGNDAPLESTSGVHAYNIHKNTKVGVVVKGMSGIRIYNNTFYNSRYSNWHCIGILENNGSDQNPPYTPARNTSIKNNIFYQKDNAPVIKIYAGAREGLEINYNIYWCENSPNNEPRFSVEGTTVSWSQWRAMGYDTNSVVFNPRFTNTNTFIPSTRINFGTPLSQEFEYGLAVTAYWNMGQYPDTIKQNGLWQPGAVIHSDSTNSDEIDAQSKLFKIFPNPNNGVFYIECSEAFRNENKEISIKTIDGATIYSDLIAKGDIKKEIRLKDVSTGLYIVSINGLSYARKIIIR